MERKTTKKHERKRDQGGRKGKSVCVRLIYRPSHSHETAKRRGESYTAQEGGSKERSASGVVLVMDGREERVNEFFLCQPSGRWMDGWMTCKCVKVTEVVGRSVEIDVVADERAKKKKENPPGE
mmetsp:Transcript_29787/g.58450  ORF Transcript_29787/g.58450 Transcript_29787/m.58450 type:complete len:124 (+) Transcript_29787:407-778(+)